MDETCVKVGGQRKSLFRAVDRDGHTVDFSLRARRDHAAARACFERAKTLLAGIKVMHLIRKGQLGAIKDPASSAANRFYSLAF